MYKKRLFDIDHLPKVDQLLYYLRKQKITFTAHAEGVGDEFKMLVFWFEPVRS